MSSIVTVHPHVIHDPYELHWSHGLQLITRESTLRARMEQLAEGRLVQLLAPWARSMAVDTLTVEMAQMDVAGRA
jgi:hypothetical protein